MFQKSLYHELKKNAVKHDNKTAILFGNHPISYKRLLDAIERLAAALTQLGVTSGDRFAVLLPNIPQFIISFFALNKLGVTVVPIPSASDSSIISTIFRTCNLKGLIALDRLFEQVQAIVSAEHSNMMVITLGDTVFPNTHNLTSLIANSEPMSHEHALPSEWTPVIFRTAGTTGQPRAVPLTQQNIAYQLEATRRALGIEANSVIFCLLPFSTAFANLASMLTPLLCGCTLVLFARIELAEVVAAFQSHSDVVLMASNFMLEEMIQKRKEFSSAPKLLAAVCIDSQMRPDRRFEFQEKFSAPVIQGYGLTEAGPFVSVYGPRYNQKNDSVGFPSFGFQIRIVDSRNQNVDVNTVGEILIQSAAVASSYLGSGEAHNASSHTPEGWFQTGDLGKLDELGHLYVVGRKLDVIVKGGFDIYPNEIKALLSQHPKVKDCAILGVRDDIFGQEIKARVVPANGNHLSKEELTAYCRQHLQAYKCPKYFEIVNSLTEKTAAAVAGTQSSAPASESAPSLNNPSVVS